MERRESFRARFPGIERDVIANGVGWPEADHGFRVEPMFLDDAFSIALRVIEELPRRFALFRIIENSGKATAHFPGLEKRRPIDIGQKLGDAIRAQHARARKSRPRRRVIRPIDLERVGSRLGQRQPLFIGLRTTMRLRYFVIFGAHRVDGRRAGMRGKQGLNDADRPARVI